MSIFALFVSAGVIFNGAFLPCQHPYFYIGYILHRSFILFFRVFNGRITRKEDLSMVVLYSKENIMENVCGGDRF